MAGARSVSRSVARPRARAADDLSAEGSRLRARQTFDDDDVYYLLMFLLPAQGSSRNEVDGAYQRTWYQITVHI